MGEGFEFSELDRILDCIITHIREGKEEVFSITEEAHEECQHIESELKDIGEKVGSIINEVDMLEDRYRQARRHLMEVSRDFATYTQEDIRRAYERAQKIQVELSQKRSREQELKYRRNELEQRLNRMEMMVKKAEKMVSHMGVALDLLEGGMDDFTSEYENLRKRFTAGARIIKAQEEERRRIAREIHDGPAQSLANIVFRIGYCQKMFNHDIEQVKEEILDIKNLVRSSLSELRRVIFNLRPVTLDDLGLIPTLRNYIDGFREDTELAIDLSVIGEPRRLPRETEVGLFRMLQEAMNNTLKHADADHLHLRIEFTTAHVRAEVIDDGQGFDTGKYLDNGQDRNFGLHSLLERAELLGGELEFETEPGKGTKVIIVIPERGK